MSNIFAVLDTSDAEDEVVQKNTAGKTKKAKEDSAPQNDAKKQQTGKPAKAQPQNKPTKEEPKPAAPAENESRKDDNRGGRARGKEGVKRGDKYHQAEGGNKQRPKREFERRSGTGRGREVSRGGRGPYGFGNAEQEAIDAEKNPANAEANGQPENADDAVEPEGESAEVVEEAEEPATLSYDDFMRQREEARASSALLASAKNVRTVNVETQFAGLTTKADNEDDESKGKVSSANKKEQRSSNKSQILDVSFKFENASENRSYGKRREFPEGGREGGRGRGREGPREGGRGRGRDNRGPREGGRGRGRENRGPRDAPGATLNSVDFPSL